MDIEISQPTPDSRGLDDYNGSDGTRMSGSYLKSGVFKHSLVKQPQPSNAFKFDGDGGSTGRYKLEKYHYFGEEDGGPLYDDPEEFVNTS